MGKVLIFKGADFSQNAIDGDKDYVLADSITFDGSHYIDLGRGLTQQSKVEICLTPTVLATGSQIIAICGVRTGANLNQFDMRLIYERGDKFAVTMTNSGSSTGAAIKGSASINSRSTISGDIKNNKVTINGSTSSNSKTVTGLNTGDFNLYIGAYNDNGTINTGFTFYQGKVHWIKIYDNGTLSNFYNAATVKATGTFCLVDRLHDENKYYFVTQ